MRGQKLRILSIDGGGIRGVIPAQILVHVEKILREISRNDQAHISDYFDLVAGTSTGGILTALILAPGKKFNASEMVDLYINHGTEIFTRSAITQSIDRLGLFNPIYQHERLEAILEDYLGFIRISELVKPCLIPTYNIETGRATFVSSLAIMQNPSRDRFVKDVVRATTAAPTYFAPARRFKEAFVDGGMFANNPALCAYIEATKFPAAPRPEEIMLLSIGTGSINRNYPYEQSRRWGRLNWIRPALEIYSSSASQTVNHQLEMLYQQKDAIDNYLRIEPNLSDFEVSFSLDDASNDNIKGLKNVGIAMSKEYDAKLRAFLQKVVLSNTINSHEKLYK